MPSLRRRARARSGLLRELRPAPPAGDGATRFAAARLDAPPRLVPGRLDLGRLPTLLVAIAGAAVAISLTEDSGANGGTTLVAAAAPLPVRGALPTPTQATALPAAPEPGAGATTTTRRVEGREPNGSLTWPASVDGWTIVLVSYPVEARPGGSARDCTARRRARFDRGRRARLVRLLEPAPRLRDRVQRHLQLPLRRRGSPDERSRNRFRKCLHEGNRPLRAMIGHS